MIQDRDSAELRELIDKEALRGIAARYARAIDRRDRELLLSCYHDDAIDHHGAMFRGGPLDYADWQPDVMAPFAVTAHYMLNSSYALDGDIAEGELYFIAYHRTHPPGAATCGCCRPPASGPPAPAAITPVVPCRRTLH